MINFAIFLLLKIYPFFFSKNNFNYGLPCTSVDIRICFFKTHPLTFPLPLPRHCFSKDCKYCTLHHCTVRKNTVNPSTVQHCNVHPSTRYDNIVNCPVLSTIGTDRGTCPGLQPNDKAENSTLQSGILVSGFHCFPTLPTPHS